jgi:hypothetical protein
VDVAGLPDAGLRSLDGWFAPNAVIPPIISPYRKQAFDSQFPIERYENPILGAKRSANFNGFLTDRDHRLGWFPLLGLRNRALGPVGSDQAGGLIGDVNGSDHRVYHTAA